MVHSTDRDASICAIIFLTFLASICAIIFLKTWFYLFFFQPADAFVGSRPKPVEDGFLYHVTMTLTGPITEDQNTRGRKIYAPEESTQSFGILLSAEIPNVRCFSLAIYRSIQLMLLFFFTLVALWLNTKDTVTVLLDYS